MKNYVICKACGYIMEADQLKDVCPACGVSAKVFEPYTSKISEQREKMISMHLHPIMVHFPQAFVVLALFFDVAALFLKGPLYEIAIAGIKINTVFLPLGVLAGALLGIYDGKLRFKRTNTPVLKFKIKLAILFQLLSVAAALIVLLQPLTRGVILLLIALTFVALVIAMVLGKTGSKLMGAAMKG